MKRQANPQLSSSGELALAQYEQTLREREDLAGASVDTTVLYIQGTKQDVQRAVETIAWT